MSNGANLSFSASTAIGGWTFNAGAPAYTFTNGQFLQFNGAGIVINGGSASITNNNEIDFLNTSTAGSASITNNNGMYFFNTSTAGNASIYNTAAWYFYNTSTAGNATITNVYGSSLVFLDTSTAGNASINNSSGALSFLNTSTAGNATITNGGLLDFYNTSTAGNAIITNNSLLRFFATSTGGQAQFITNLGGTFDMSPLTAAGMTAGSIAGAGTYNLSSKQLTVGGNNLSTTVSGVISGTGGALVKEGTGTLTLSGIDTYSGATTVNAGTLAVNGSIAASSLTTVNANGALFGTGTVGNTLIAGGIFMPGSGTPGSSMTVSGTLGFTGASTYLVDINPTTSSFANVTGTATLGGATVNAFFANGSYIAKQYTILTAGSVSGTFGSLANTNLPANFSDTLSYDATHAYLNLILSFTTPAPGGLSDNQNNVANALINFFNTTGGIPLVFSALSANGLTQVSGEAAAGSTQASFDASNQFLNMMLDPFNDSRNDEGGGASSFADEVLGYAAKKRDAKASDAFAAVTPRDRRAASFERRWSVWASGYGGASSVSDNATTGTHSTTSRIYGTAVGTDYRVTPNTLIGFALGGAGFNYGLSDGLGGGRAELFQAGVFGRHTMGAAYVAAALAYGWQDVTTDRTVTIAGTDRLHAGFNAHTFAARGETGWRFATPYMGLTPYAALQSTSFMLPSYSESATSGSNQFALAYAAKTTTDVRSELGLRADKAFLLRDGVFTLRGRAAWAHDSNTDRPVTATFQALPGATFTVTGAQPAANAALLTAGAEMKWRNGISLAGTFDGEFSRTTQSYAGKGTVRYAW